MWSIMLEVVKLFLIKLDGAPFHLQQIFLNKKKSCKNKIISIQLGMILTKDFGRLSNAEKLQVISWYNWRFLFANRSKFLTTWKKFNILIYQGQNYSVGGGQTIFYDFFEV